MNRSRSRVRGFEPYIYQMARATSGVLGFGLLAATLLAILTGAVTPRSASAQTSIRPLTFENGFPAYVAVTASPSSLSILQTLTLSVTVSSPMGGTPTGSVNVSSYNCGTSVVLIGGSATLTCPPGSLPTGNEVEIQVQYIPDNGNFVSSSGSTTVTVSAGPPTTIALQALANGSPASNILRGDAVTLIAAAQAGGKPITPGQVLFCSGQCGYSYSGVFATAQLTPDGTARTTLRPGFGEHGYVAVFMGTPNGSQAFGGGISNTVNLNVALPDKAKTNTTLSVSGSPSDYSFSATVIGAGAWTAPPTGTVTFQDTTIGLALEPQDLGGGPPYYEPGLNFTIASPLPWIQAPYTPNSIVVGDFNGDEHLDLAVANEGANNVQIYLGKGDGTFTTGENLPVGGGPTSVALGDFNSDGKLDLVLTNRSGPLTILLGNGDGTFTPTASAPAIPAVFVAVGDFNLDGIQDLAVVDSSDQKVTILLGNGDGTFTTKNTLSIVGDPQTIGIGDFDGDGILDLVVTSWGACECLGQAYGSGDGTFVVVPPPPGQPSYLGIHTNAVIVAPFGVLGYNRDLILAEWDGSGHSDLRNASAGTGRNGFFPSNAFAQSQSPYAIAVGDFRGNGQLDLIAGEWNPDSTTVSVFLNGAVNSNGPLATQADPLATQDVGGADPAIAAGDFNEDGIADLAVANSAGNIAVLLANPTGITTAPYSGVQIAGTAPHSIEASYSGDNLYGPSTSSPVVLNAQIIAPGVMVDPASETIPTSEGVSVLVTVYLSSAVFTTLNPPTGTVILTSGSYNSPATTLIGGGAAFSIPPGSLGVGANVLMATYTPDSASSGLYMSSSGATTVQVNPPGYSLVATPLAIAQGLEDTSIVTISSIGGYVGTISFACAITSSPAGALNLPTCTVTAPVTLTSTTQSGLAQVTVQTTATKNAALDRPKLNGPEGRSEACGLSFLAFLVFLCIPARRRPWWSALFLMSILVGLISCGGGSLAKSSDPPSSPVQTIPGTTTGAYTVTVTGTGDDPARTVETTTFALTVK